MTEPKEQAVPVVGVGEAVERLTKFAEWFDDEDNGESAPIDAHSQKFTGYLCTILQALQGSSACADTHRATEQPVVGWRPIESAPRDGTEVIVFHGEAGVCAAFCPGEGFSWHVMDGQNTYIGPKSGKSLPSLTSFLEPPTHWMPLPAGPSDSGKAALGGYEAEGGVNKDLQAQLKAAYEALEPFAKVGGQLMKTPDHRPLTLSGKAIEHDGMLSNGTWNSLTAGHFRAARQALARRGEG